MNTLLTLILIFFGSPVWSYDGTWSILNTTGTKPSPRSAPGLELINNDIYLLGGIKDDFKLKHFPTYMDIYRLNLKTNQWETIVAKGKLPPERAFNATTYVKDKDSIFIFGGNRLGRYYVFGYKAFNDMWAYSLSKNTWMEIYPINAGPSGRGAPMEWRMGNKWYIFGGISSWFQMLNDLWVYDIDTNEWTCLIPNKAVGSPPGRYMEETRGSELIWRGKLILQGGEGFYLSLLPPKAIDTSFDDVWEYDLKTNQWKNITPEPKNNIPRGQNSASTGIIGDYLYIQGGDLDEGGVEGCSSPFNQNLTNELWRLDLINHVWTKLSPKGVTLPTLKRTNGIVIDGKLYIFYGFDFQCKDGVGPGQIWNTNIYVYDPQEK